MLPTIQIRQALGTLLAADTATLAPAAANKMILVNAPFAMDENVLPAQLPEATFTGYAAINGTIVAQETGLDPNTGQQILTLTPPAAGWRWVCSASPATPETIYGYALLNSSKAKVYALQTFPTPIVIAALNQQIDLGAAALRFVLQPAS